MPCVDGAEFRLKGDLDYRPEPLMFDRLEKARAIHRVLSDCPDLEDEVRWALSAYSSRLLEEERDAAAQLDLPLPH